MKVTITKLRQDLFRLIDSARDGEPLEFAYKGTLFRIVPEAKPSKLAKLTRQTVVAPASQAPASQAMGAGTLDEASRAMLSEMQAEWEKDWSEL